MYEDENEDDDNGVKSIGIEVTVRKMNRWHLYPKNRPTICIFFSKTIVKTIIIKERILIKLRAI